MRYFLAALLALVLSGCDNNTQEPESAPGEATDMSAAVADIPATDWQNNADQTFQNLSLIHI